MKLLGVTIDSKFNFNDISTICKKAIPSQRIGVLMRLRNLIPTKAKLILFKSVLSFTVLYVLPFSLAFL